MMDTNADNDVTVSAAETVPPLSVGKILSEARISQGLSIADVAAEIKFAPRQVEALEADDFSHLPELPFVRGFVRSYARMLHIDDKRLLDALPQANQPLSGSNEMAEVPFPTMQSTKRSNAVWLGAALGVAVLLGISVLVFQKKPAVPKMVEPSVSLSEEVATTQVDLVASPESSVSSIEQPASSVAVVIPVAAQEPQVIEQKKPASESNKPIHLVFKGESWVDIKDRFGKTRLKQINEPGSEQWVGGQAPFNVVIGNASGVRLYYQSEEVDLEEFTEVEVARLILEE